MAVGVVGLESNFGLSMLPPKGEAKEKAKPLNNCFDNVAHHAGELSLYHHVLEVEGDLRIDVVEEGQCHLGNSPYICHPYPKDMSIIGPRTTINLINLYLSRPLGGYRSSRIIMARSLSRSRSRMSR